MSIYDSYTKEQWKDRCLAIERRMDQLEAEIRRLKTENSKLRLISDRQWQPIATAPKDGAPILGYDGYDMVTVYWQSKWGETKGYWALCESGSFARDNQWEPICWMPLPQRNQE